MTTQQLDYIDTIIKCGSFSAAEENLFVSRQALMKQINHLEQELGFVIFDRNHQGVALTEAGKNFVEGIRAIRGQIRTLAEDCRNIENHAMELRVELPDYPNAILDEAIERYHQKYPDVRISIVMRNSRDREKRLLQGEVDAAEYLRASEIEEGLEYTPFIHTGYFCLMSRNHPLAEKSEISAEELSGYMLYTSRLSVRQDLVAFLSERHCTRELIAVEDHELNQIRNICYNKGIFLTPAYFAKKMQNMKAIPLKDSPEKEIGILTRANPPEKVRDFVKTAREFFLQGM